MPAGVYTPDLRIQFVEGWLTGGTDPEDGSVEVGDDTRYPLEATLDQIAEMFYRVSDTQPGGGTLGDGVSTDPIVAIPTARSTNRAWASKQLVIDDTDPENIYYDYSTSEFARGYPIPTQTITDGGAPVAEITPTAHDTAYLFAQYSAGTQYGQWEADPPAVEIERFYRDLGDSERGVWCDVWDEGITTANGSSAPADYIATAFSFRSYDQGSTYLAARPNVFCTTSLGVFVDPVTTAFLEFSGKVAAVRQNPGDGFFAATNRFFVECEFYCSSSTWESSLYEWSSAKTLRFSGGTPVTACDYIIRLSSGDISFPVYSLNDYGSSSDIIHEATDWFPYAKNSPATPVWTAATGAKL